MPASFYAYKNSTRDKKRSPPAANVCEEAAEKGEASSRVKRGSQEMPNAFIGVREEDFRRDAARHKRSKNSGATFKR